MNKSPAEESNGNDFLHEKREHKDDAGPCQDKVCQDTREDTFRVRLLRGGEEERTPGIVIHRHDQHHKDAKPVICLIDPHGRIIGQ